MVKPSQARNYNVNNKTSTSSQNTKPSMKKPPEHQENTVQFMHVSCIHTNVVIACIHIALWAHELFANFVQHLTSWGQRLAVARSNKCPLTMDQGVRATNRYLLSVAFFTPRLLVNGMREGGGFSICSTVTPSSLPQFSTVCHRAVYHRLAFLPTSFPTE